MHLHKLSCLSEQFYPCLCFLQLSCLSSYNNLEPSFFFFSSESLLGHPSSCLASDMLGRRSLFSVVVPKTYSSWSFASPNLNTDSVVLTL